METHDHRRLPDDGETRPAPDTSRRARRPTHDAGIPDRSGPDASGSDANGPAAGGRDNSGPDANGQDNSRPDNSRPDNSGPDDGWWDAALSAGPGSTMDEDDHDAGPRLPLDRTFASDGLTIAAAWTHDTSADDTGTDPTWSDATRTDDAWAEDTGTGDVTSDHPLDGRLGDAIPTPEGPLPFDPDSPGVGHHLAAHRSVDVVGDLWAMASAVVTERAVHAVTSPSGRVVCIDRLARLSRRYDALLASQVVQLFDDLAAFYGGQVELAHDAVVAELRAALRLTRRSAERVVADALAADRFPNLMDAWSGGRLDRRKVRLIVEALSPLDDDTAERICAEVLERAAGLTTGQLRAWLRRLVVAADPQAAAARETAGRRERRVELSAAWDGTARLTALGLPAAVAVAAYDRIDRLAHRHQDDRTIDQRRADVLCDLLLGTADGTPVSVSLHVQADLGTLASLNDAPGELAGFGPISADLVRRLADTADIAHGGVTYRVDDDDGRPVADGYLPRRRRPTTDQRRTVVIRDRTCIFPGCRTPAHRCDLDHRIPWAAGGATHPGQLVALCRHDHGLRHRLGWEHRPTADHDHTWTSPTGHRYRTHGPGGPVGPARAVAAPLPPAPPPGRRIDPATSREAGPPVGHPGGRGAGRPHTLRGDRTAQGSPRGPAQGPAP